MIEHQDHIDFSHVPESQGITPTIKWVLFIGIACIFAIGGFSGYLGGYGHMWPANTTLRAPLPPLPQ